MSNCHCKLKGKLSIRTSGTQDVYEGPYSVTPLETPQIFETSNKAMIFDMQVGAIPSSYVNTDDATLDSGNKLLLGVTAYANGVKYEGTIPHQPARTYTPTIGDQIIIPGIYLDGPQVIQGDYNLRPENIAAGTAIFGVMGTLPVINVVQDNITKILSIT